MREYRIESKVYDTGGFITEKSQYFAESPDELFEKFKDIYFKDFFYTKNDDDTFMGYMTYDEGGMKETYVLKWNNFDNTEKQRYEDFINRLEKHLA